ncbi:FecR family protein [Flavobacterium flavipallidum]|uniref:FecR family protein n=1 Tax=Flavobacterium flavipallidum TaxID=3139140 RepID=A0ABU9HH71_9FLAO
MEQNRYTQNLLKKFILNQCSKEEVDEVVHYFKSLTDSNQLPTVEEVLEILEDKPLMRESDIVRIKNKILAMSQEDSKLKLNKKFYFVKYAAAAAIFIGVLTSVYFFKDIVFQKQIVSTPVIVQKNTFPEPGTDKATLTLSNGKQIVLTNGASLQTQNAKSNGEAIIYQSEKNNTAKLVYNYLTIPRGGKFMIKLSDGTQVWLNSETQLKFPVAFIEGKTREVELVYGEAYFDVSPSTMHKGAHFKVLNKKQEIEVIGTEFNIKAYKDETNSYTTLVEGKVDVKMENGKQRLKPNQQLKLNLKTNNVSVQNIDVYNAISWKQGVFSFENITLKEMMKVLSRWYDFDCIFKNKAIENEIFDGVLRKNQSLDEILKSIKNFKIIKNYEIKDKQVILE